MKKTVFILLVLAITATAAIPVWAESVSVKVNGNFMSFPDAQPFIDSNGRTQVPVRFVAEALDCKVSWQECESLVCITRGMKVITLKIGDTKALVNGVDKGFDSAAILQEGRTFVPLRFVSEALGAKVEWVASNQTVMITTEDTRNIDSRYQLNSADIDTVNGWVSQPKSELICQEALKNFSLEADGSVTGMLPDILPLGYKWQVAIIVTEKDGAIYTIGSRITHPVGKSFSVKQLTTMNNVQKLTLSISFTNGAEGGNLIESGATIIKNMLTGEVTTYSCVQ